jgi:hypothetical protein
MADVHLMLLYVLQSMDFQQNFAWSALVKASLQLPYFAKKVVELASH